MTDTMTSQNIDLSSWDTLYNFFLMKPARCTLLLSIFISNSLHVSGNYVPIVRTTYCIYATLVFFTVYGWLSANQTEKDYTGMQVTKEYIYIYIYIYI